MRQKTGGRQKGSLNKKTTASNAVKLRELLRNISEVCAERLWELVNEPGAKNIKDMIDILKISIPYLLPKLQAITNADGSEKEEVLTVKFEGGSVETLKSIANADIEEEDEEEDEEDENEGQA